jgi:hypothetical protein
MTWLYDLENAKHERRKKWINIKYKRILFSATDFIIQKSKSIQLIQWELLLKI